MPISNPNSPRAVIVSAITLEAFSPEVERSSASITLRCAGASGEMPSCGARLEVAIAGSFPDRMQSVVDRFIVRKGWRRRGSFYFCPECVKSLREPEIQVSPSIWTAAADVASRLGKAVAL